MMEMFYAINIEILGGIYENSKIMVINGMKYENILLRKMRLILKLHLFFIMLLHAIRSNRKKIELL